VYDDDDKIGMLGVISKKQRVEGGHPNPTKTEREPETASDSAAAHRKSDKSFTPVSTPTNESATASFTPVSTATNESATADKVGASASSTAAVAASTTTAMKAKAGAEFRANALPTTPAASSSSSSASSSMTATASSSASSTAAAGTAAMASTIGADLNVKTDENRSKKYETTLDGLKATLEEYGVAIIPNVLNVAECQHMVDGMWSYLEHVSQKFEIPIRRDDCKTWKQIEHLWPMHWMLLKQYGIGQTQMSWDLRQNPKVAAPFAKLWNTKAENLLCSFDGASFQMPPEVTGHGWNNQRSWWHTDQSLYRNEFECVQGWVTAFDTGLGDATLGVLEASHKLHADFNKHFNITQKPPQTDETEWKKTVSQLKKDWFKLEPKHVEWYQKTKGCDPVYIQCPAGSMVFWDSRTIHYGREAVQGRTSQNRIRCIAYICMTPRRLCTDANLKKRIKAFSDIRTTSHWPHKPKMNPTAPRTYGKPIKPITDISKPNLTPLGKRLVGY
jgi:hypothetical protein